MDSTSDSPNFLTPQTNTLIGVVGPCTSGKTSLSQWLKEQGFNARPIAQEHSEIPDMWRKLTNPDILIFLDITEEASFARKPIKRMQDWLAVQHERLSNARENAQLYLQTASLAQDEVRQRVLEFLDDQLK